MKAMLCGLAVALGLVGTPSVAAELPIFDAHIHYSHDAWEKLPPKQAVAILRQAGLRARWCPRRTTRAPRCWWPRRPT